MINLAQFSGGKDSTAMLLYLKEQGIEYTAVFCDTGWEHPLTYIYIEEINQTLLGGKLVRLKSEKYDDFSHLVAERGIPSNHRRFCTEELKVKPIHAYIESLEDEVTSYVGIRADESLARSRSQEREWVDAAGGYWLSRPLLRWTAEQCFEITRRYDIKPNPLYLMGMGRVGCFPCINVTLRELRAFLRSSPEIKDRLRALETSTISPSGARTFFRHRYIPERYCSIEWTTGDGRKLMIPTVDDVFRYLESVDENQLPLFEAPRCMSIYNLCE